MINLIHLGMILLCSFAFEKCVANTYFDDYVRAVEGGTATLSCPAGNIIVQEKITFGNGYRTQTCSDPDAANKLAPYCAFKQTCTITADRNLFTGSTCNPSITEYFQARWWCRPDYCVTYCANGGTCVVSNSVSSCNCTGDWSGTNCEVSPCVNVTCAAGQTCLVDTSTGTSVCAGGCNGDVTTAASGLCPTDFGYYADPGDCTSYIQCNWGQPIRINCGSGKKWSQDLMTCIAGSC